MREFRACLFPQILKQSSIDSGSKVALSKSHIVQSMPDVIDLTLLGFARYLNLRETQLLLAIVALIAAYLISITTSVMDIL